MREALEKKEYAVRRRQEQLLARETIQTATHDL